MATLTLTGIRAFNIHPGTTAHITGKSHTYVTFSVNGAQETTSVFDSEASQHAVWKDTITMHLNSGASGELKVCRAFGILLKIALHCVLLCRRCFYRFPGCSSAYGSQYLSPVFGNVPVLCQAIRGTHPLSLCVHACAIIQLLSVAAAYCGPRPTSSLVEKRWWTLLERSTAFMSSDLDAPACFRTNAVYARR